MIRVTLFIFSLFVMTALPALSAGDTHAGHHSGKSHEKAAALPETLVSKPDEANYTLPVIRSAADFRLTDPGENEVTLGDFGGKIKVVSFIYTSCPDACLLATGVLSRLQGMLRDEGLLGGKVKLASITFDPERDTPKRLAEYAEGFGADGKSWLFLRGSAADTRAVLSEYDIWTKALPDGRIDHVMRVYLIDGEDNIREIYNLAYLHPELVVNDINTILRKTASHAGY